MVYTSRIGDGIVPFTSDNSVLLYSTTSSVLQREHPLVWDIQLFLLSPLNHPSCTRANMQTVYSFVHDTRALLSFTLILAKAHHLVNHPRSELCEKSWAYNRQWVKSRLGLRRQSESDIERLLVKLIGPPHTKNYIGRAGVLSIAIHPCDCCLATPLGF